MEGLKKTRPAPWTLVKRQKKKPKNQFLKEIYIRRKKEFLAANPWCAVELKLRNKKVRSTEVHHRFGRRGPLLNWEKGWLAVSRKNHDWIHRNIEEARKHGLIADRGKWNNTELVYLYP